jgi:hypothetical protein
LAEERVFGAVAVEVSSTLISRTLAGYLFDMQITFPREKVRIKPGMGSLTDEG